MAKRDILKVFKIPSNILFFDFLNETFTNVSLFTFVGITNFIFFEYFRFISFKLGFSTTNQYTRLSANIDDKTGSCYYRDSIDKRWNNSFLLKRNVNHFFFCRYTAFFNLI